MSNIFSRLYQRRQKEQKNNDEDYCTEILAIILDALAKRHQAEHAKLLCMLDLSGVLEDKQQTDWRTQCPRCCGRFDILASQNGNPKIAIEVKKDAPLDAEQLNRYRTWLSENGGGLLCSLTVDGQGVELENCPPVRYVPLSWSIVSDSLSKLKVPELEIMIGEARNFWKDWKMSYRPANMADFETVMSASESEEAIRFLLNGQYNNIAECIRPETTQIEETQRKYEEGVDTRVYPKGLIRWRAVEQEARVWVGWGFVWDGSHKLFEDAQYEELGESGTSRKPYAVVVAGIENGINRDQLSVPAGWRWSSTLENTSYASTIKPVCSLLNEAGDDVDPEIWSAWVKETYNNATPFIRNLVA